MAAHLSALDTASISNQAVGASKDRVIAPAGASSTVELPEEACPVCRRVDSLVRLGETSYCAACGYASDGAAGCT